MLKETYPGGCLITSLVTLIFLTHPKHNSSSENSSFFSTSGGFLLVVVCENMIGVVDLRLGLFERETGWMRSFCLELRDVKSSFGEVAELGNNSGSEISILLFLLLMILLRDDVAISVALLRLSLRVNDIGVVHLLLPCLDRGLVLGFGVFDLLLSHLATIFGLQISASALFFSLRSKNKADDVGSCMHAPNYKQNFAIPNALWHRHREL